MKKGIIIWLTVILIVASVGTAHGEIKPLERISIRASDTGAEFILMESGTPFFVKGFNYIRLRGGHATFDAATKTTKANYEPDRAEAMFSTLSKLGYNTVRVFIAGRSKYTPGIAGNYDTTKAIYEPYMENVLDFLRRATRHGIRVFPTFGDGEVPRNAYYRERLPEKGQNKNLLILTSTEQRQALMDAGYRYYHKCIVAAVKAIDPDMLVSEGVFVPRAVGKDPIKHAGVWPGQTSDDRYPPTLTTIGTGALDFLDVHFYHVTANPSNVASQFRRNLGSTNFFTPQMTEIRKKTPVIMGEFGAFDDHEKTFEAAVDNLVQVRDLANKENVNGMLFWTYDCQEQERLYHATDDWPLFYSKMGTFEKVSSE